MKKLLFGIPIVLFILIVYADFFEKHPMFIYIGAVISFVSLTTGFYMEYKNNQDTFRKKYLHRIVMGAFFIVTTWSVALYNIL